MPSFLFAEDISSTTPPSLRATPPSAEGGKEICREWRPRHSACLIVLQTKQKRPPFLTVF